MQFYLENLYASDGHYDVENVTEDDIQTLDPSTTTADGTAGNNTLLLQQQQLQLETDFTKAKLLQVLKALKVFVVSMIKEEIDMQKKLPDWQTD